MKGANYTRFDVRSNRDDYGLLLHSNYTYAKRHVVSMGLEYKMGSVKGGDYYQTSSDVVLNSGSQTFMALYIQNELQLLSDKLNITTGIRLDNVKFQDGLFQAKGSNVDYWTAYSPKLTDHSWNAISPKASIQYSLLTNLSAYASWSKGFRASILDDLCRSGWMWVGPKVANPELGPEYINNYESGLKFVLFKKLILEPGIYFLDGKDFLYYVANGDTLSNRPVYRRENISKVSCKGIEIDVRFNVNPKISFWTNYTYNTSKILEFIKNPELEGKYLKYTPKHKASLGCIWLNKYIDTGLGFMYKDKQYSNDMNSAEIEDYFTIDFQLSRSFYHSRLTTSLNIQDLFNNRHMETSDYLSPGRLVTFKIQYKL
jgi:iron complex outermembrane receptor protein